MGDDPETALTTIAMGPSLLDDHHAYLVVGVVVTDTPTSGSSTQIDSFPEELTCPVVMLKVRLTDGVVVASATVSENFSASQIVAMHLSFSIDRASLLLAGGREVPPLVDNIAEYVGLRLSVEDLSFQFDAHSVFDGNYAESGTSYGQAIASVDSMAPGKSIVFLATGEREFVEGKTPILVRDGWFYCEDSSGQGWARELSSGQVVELAGEWKEEIRLW
ncbi:MAG: hypothetical protein Q4D79_08230 [Propionibacteriaceae bacterium]|nr:hypothetical protein [Propionibacteriaceae bacterium]